MRTQKCMFPKNVYVFFKLSNYFLEISNLLSNLKQYSHLQMEEQTMKDNALAISCRG